MAEEPNLGDILDETRDFSEKESLSPKQYEEIKDAVHSDIFKNIARAERAYFILGKYDDGERERRLEDVRDQLKARDGSFAYLMKDVPEAWEFWPTKFRILANRATWIVPVLEDTDGSHEWELGRIDGPEYRPKVYILKRVYDSEEKERKLFDALPADFIKILDRNDRVFKWETEADLEDAVEQLP